MSDAENLPKQAKRPDYQSMNAVTALLDDEPEAEESANAAGATTSGNPGSNIRAATLPNDSQSEQSPQQLTPEQKKLTMQDRTVFTVPEGHSVFSAAEIAGGIGGIRDKDCYLFITQDGTAGQSGRHAFVVPKDEPHNQREISLDNVSLDTDTTHELRATLAGGHSVVFGIGYTYLDGKSVHGIHSTDAIGSLVKEKGYLGGYESLDQGYYTAMYFTGDSWVLMRKDAGTGIIEKFTQSGTTDRGKLEIIQGNPYDYKTDSSGRLRVVSGDPWLSNGETERKAKATTNNATMPDDMKEHVALVGEQLRKGVAENRRVGDIRALPILEQLTDIDVGLSEYHQRSAALAERLNARENQKQQNSVGRQQLKSVRP